MGRFVVQRLALAVVLVFLVATVVFALIHLMPGDPVLVILGSERTPDPAVVEAVRAKLGLDQPLPAQYTRWLGNMARLDFGNSLVDDRPVWTTLAERLPRTLELVLLAITLATLIGIPMGVVAALRRNQAQDTLLSMLAAVGISAPVYVIGSLLVLLFGVTLRWLPVAGYVAFGVSPVQHIQRLILPVIALSLGPTAIITRLTRSSLLDVLGQDYIRTARAKGLRHQIVIYRHAVRAALIPVVTAIGLQMGTLIGGSVLVEYIFNWPGLSTLLVTAIGRRDYPTVQGVILVSSTLFILINMLVELMYGYLDPRIRYS